MSYDGIMWGPSIRGYMADNKQRIKRCESSLAFLKNQDGQYANDHRLLLALYREIASVISKHVEQAECSPASRPSRGAL